MIPFYGSDDRELFDIERSAMDRPGRVVATIDDILPPSGTILDVGAGDGFTATRLSTSSRRVVALEPSAGMVDRSRPLPWVRGLAQNLPFADAAFAAAYSTWAYFFPQYWDISAGLDELHRVVAPGGPIVIVDNAGDDEFCALSSNDIATDLVFWRSAGFDVSVVDTVFAFETLADAGRLLRLFFGPETTPQEEIQFRVAVMVTRSHGSR